MADAVFAEFDQAELDREYSPSSCVEDLQVFLDAYRTRSIAAKARAEERATLMEGLRYGARDTQSLDFFLPDTDKPVPLQIFVHGGYWQQLHKDDSSFAATAFLEQGCAFAAVNYTLAPAVSLSEIIAENRRAITWLHEHAEELGFDPTRVFVSGSSAGAHICLMLLMTDWREYAAPTDLIKGVCALSGIYDLEPVRLTYVNENVRMDAAEARAMSPMCLTVKNRCPIIFAYGDNETSEFKRQSDDYVALLRDEGLDVSVHEIRGRNHFDVVFELADTSSPLFRAVVDQMRMAR